MAAKTKKKGRDERKAKGKGRQRTPAKPKPSKPSYKREAPDLEFGREQFRFTVPQTASSKVSYDLDEIVESASWEDSSAMMTGSLTLRKPPDGKDVSIPLGSKVVCSVQRKPGAAFQPLWEMRVSSPSGSAPGGSRTLQLESELRRAAVTRMAAKYRKSKRKPKGWLPHEIVADACKSQGFKVKELAKTTKPMKSLVDDNVSLWGLIRRAYGHEVKQTGKRFVMDYTGGLRVRSLRYPQYMLIFAETIISATVTRSWESSLRGEPSYATAVTVRGKRPTGSKKKKRKTFSVKVRNESAIRRYGYVHRFIDAPEAGSESAARKEGKRALARLLNVKREVTFSHPGIPFLKRGDALRVKVPDEHLNAQVYVTSVSHALSPGEYTMDVEVSFEPPQADVKSARTAKKRKKAAQKRKRPSAGKGAKDSKPKPKKAQQRSPARKDRA